MFALAALSSSLYAKSYYSNEEWTGKDEVFTDNQTFYKDWTSRDNNIEAPKFTLYGDSDWKSVNDTIKTDGLTFYAQSSADNGLVDISGLKLTAGSTNMAKGGTIADSTLNISEGLALGASTTSFASLLTISNSEITAGTLSVSGANNAVIIKDSTTALNMSQANVSSSAVKDGASLTIDGGKFIANLVDSPRSLHVISATLTVKNAEMDMSGGILTTRANGKQNAEINFVGSTFTGRMDLYTYDSQSNTSIVNIAAGSVVNVESLHESGAGIVRGGTINVDNATFNLANSMAQSEASGSQVYTTKLNVSNGGQASIAGALDIAETSVDNATLKADSIVVGEDGSLSVTGASSIDADMLTVVEGSSVSIDSEAVLDLGGLEVVLTSASLKSGVEFDLGNIFGDDASVVLSAVDNNITMSDSLGNMFEAIVSGDGVITAGAAIPEPSAVAALLGALALAVAAFRRR